MLVLQLHPITPQYYFILFKCPAPLGLLYMHQCLKPQVSFFNPFLTFFLLIILFYLVSPINDNDKEVSGGQLQQQWVQMMPDMSFRPRCVFFSCFVFSDHTPHPNSTESVPATCNHTSIPPATPTHHTTVKHNKTHIQHPWDMHMCVFFFFLPQDMYVCFWGFNTNFILFYLVSPTNDGDRELRCVSSP